VHSEDRVRKGAEKLQKYLNSKQQGRLDGFFTVKPKEKAPPPAKGKNGKADAKSKGTKRKVRFIPLSSCSARSESSGIGRRKSGEQYQET
jgi:hypothetical protein